MLQRYLTETGHTEETLKAWQEFLAEWLPKIRQRVTKRIRGPQEEERREDCSQDVVIKILQALLGSFDASRDRFNQWISVIVSHAITDFRRCEGRANKRVKRVSDNKIIERFLDNAKATESEVEPSWNVELLNKVKALFEAHQDNKGFRAFWLRHHEGWTVPAIAQELGLTENQVYQYIHRVKERLQALFLPSGGPKPKKKT